MNKKCVGCGAILQNNDINAEGYVTEISEKNTICQRCFRLKFYGDYIFVDKDNKAYKKIISSIGNTNDLVLYLVDLFNFDEDIKNIRKLVASNPLILVVTKKDLLPKSLKEKKIINWVNEYNLDYKDIAIISSEKNLNFDDLLKKINLHRTSDKVYVVGNTNAGKSTFINRMVKNYTENNPTITTSLMPSTTLDMMEINLNNGIVLVDTPGVLVEGHILNQLYDMKTIKKVVPKKEIKPITFQMKTNQTVLIDELGRVDYIGDKNSFTFFFSNALCINRINITTARKDIKKFNREIIEVGANEDIVINGLGWIKIVKPCVVAIYTIPGVSIYKRKSLF